MNGRNIISLVNETTPGLESCPESSSCANGLSRARSAGVQRDGWCDPGEPRIRRRPHGLAIQMVDPDAVQEVRVEDRGRWRSVCSSCNGHHQYQVEGTNHLHGSLFETVRNNSFGIAPLLGRISPSTATSLLN